MSSLLLKDLSFNFYFLLPCSNIKGLRLPISSIFYKDAVASWCAHRGILQALVPIVILEEQICGNSHIQHRNTPLFFDQFSKSGIKLIEHIWDEDRLDFVDENVIFHRLADKRNVTKHYKI